MRPCGTAEPATAEPVAIRVHAESRLLEIEWRDGGLSLLSHADLRRRCRCGGCEQLRRTGGEPGGPADVGVIDVTPYGANALQFHFSDGHARGIFPFDYLHKLDRSAAKQEPADVRIANRS